MKLVEDKATPTLLAGVEIHQNQDTSIHYLCGDYLVILAGNCEAILFDTAEGDVAVFGSIMTICDTLDIDTDAVVWEAVEIGVINYTRV